MAGTKPEIIQIQKFGTFSNLAPNLKLRLASSQQVKLIIAVFNLGIIMNFLSFAILYNFLIIMTIINNRIKKKGLAFKSFYDSLASPLQSSKFILGHSDNQSINGLQPPSNNVPQRRDSLQLSLGIFLEKYRLSSRIAFHCRF